MTLPSFGTHVTTARWSGVIKPQFMTEPTKTPVAIQKLHCHWVDDEPFEIKPGPGTNRDAQLLGDTAFLLKPRARDRAAGTNAAS